ncbi:Uncharacterized protein OBRU01_15423 [Operophtera brumata]|uniref:Transforming acidic coiled-coil-containing protein C-terminal domain-containing protein n=1 Tax=Operophtera brumata TaxID=104452 RepID=A0A0L7KYT3_OPEBR|nr:Uncharacterized protein OBRU01_15423 [Operophtera brumata]
MAHNVEPMDLDCMDSDDKENTYHHTNVPCTEKGYEELDVSELNMKLRYSITPTTSPMSKSYTAYFDNRNLDSDDSLNGTIENANLTRSLNSTMMENDTTIRSLKTLPLQTISTEQVLRQLDSTIIADQEVGLEDETYCEDQLQVLSSTPISAHRSRDGSTPKRSSSLKDSIVFSDDLEKELQWKDETILFSEEKIPIHKLFLPQIKPTPLVSASLQNIPKPAAELNLTVEYMDISYNSSMVLDQTVTETHNNNNSVESDGEFVDCETTFTKNEYQNSQSKLEIQNDTRSGALEILHVTKENVNENEVQKSVEKTEKEILMLEVAPESLDITRDIEQQNIPAVNEAVEHTENEDIFSTGAVILDDTRDIAENIPEAHKNVPTTNNENQKEPITGVVNILAITREIVNENVPDVNESSENSKIQKETSADTSKNFDATIEIVGEKDLAVSECGMQENAITSVEGIVSAEGDVSLLPKYDEQSAKIRLVQKAEDEANDNAPHKVTLGVEHIPIPEEKLNEGYIIIENLNESNVLNESEMAFKPGKEDSNERDINISQLIESEKMTDKGIEENPRIPEEKLNEGSMIIENLNESNAMNESEMAFEPGKDNSNERDINISQLIESEKTTDKGIEENPRIPEEKLNEGSMIIENLNESNAAKESEMTFEPGTEDSNERDINISQLIEKPTDKGIEDTESISTEPPIGSVPNIETKIDVKEFENVNFDPQVLECNKDLNSKTDSTEHNIVKYPLENPTDKIINACPEVQTEGQTQLSNDFDVMPKEKPKEDRLSTFNLLAEEPANIPLPDDDFDIDLGLNHSKVKTIDAMPPDVLDTVITETKLDVTETLDKILDDTYINENEIREPEVLHLSEKVDILNDTNDIVNSLNEIIGESQNNTIMQCIDLSQSEPMKGIEFTEEIHVLPDLVNQTLNNMTVESAIVPELTTQSQFAGNTVTVDETHNLPNVIEDFKPETYVTIVNAVMVITEQSHESINAKTGQTDAISVPTENFVVAPETVRGEVIVITEQSHESINPKNEQIVAISIPTENIEVIETVHDELKGNEGEKVPKIYEVLNKDIIPDAEVKENIEVPIIDEELVVSINNSPYVSTETETLPTEGFEKNDIPLATNETPSSPPIRSKGYNFNFDEMDDPFAMQLCPPPTPIKLDEPEKEKFGASKKVVSNRRRSQPPERKRHAFNKKKFSTSFDSRSDTNYPDNRSNDQNSPGDSKKADIINDTTVTMEINDAADKEVAKITQILEKMAEENIDASPENDLSNVIFEEKVTLAAETNANDKTSAEYMTTATNEIKTSSSEHSTYYSTVASSSGSSISRNVFNLPEIDDKNFNPFATKSKMRLSPPLAFENEKPSQENPLLSTQNITSKLDSEDKMDTELMEKDTSYNASNSTFSSEAKYDKNITTCEVNTEDEDTKEGPFLEAEDAIDNCLGIDNDDMMQFSEITAQASDKNVDGGELFIDAEAFDFLLNQNKSNVVVDSGKESLFLKFDPLFATRISSDGVLSALNKVQRRQSTPTKPNRPSLRNEASPMAGPSILNATYEGETNVTQDSFEDLNVTVAKPMMVVTPAVNPAITPRNKTTTPPRSNRRSITFTSPAMAVIDRLLSLSGNNSLLGHDTTIANRERTEADIALTQLRELLAEKEISVYQLRSESKELKDRLSTMETQVKILETDGQDRLKKINELNYRLTEKTKINKSMAAVVEEYERTIASLIAETEQDKKQHAKEKISLINERDEQTAHLASMEVSFSDLHSKYEKSKQVIICCKANEETCKKSIKDFEENFTKMQTNYETLKQHATSKLNHANHELQKMNKAHESEVLKLNAMIKRKDMHITSLEETLVQKTKANEELTAICDELINKVG